LSKDLINYCNDCQRLRITFAKGENLRYISHLDLARTWERALRRAGIPVAYSRGYHPHPKIVFAAALSVGCTSEAEVMDITLTQPMPPRRARRGLMRQLPAGLTVLDATPVYRRAPSLPTLLQGADYESVIETTQALEQAAEQCRALLARQSIPRVYRGKSYDLRPLVDDLEATTVNHRHLLIRMQLAAGTRGTGRPNEVLDELGWAALFHRCHRRRLRFAAWVDKS
jgi:radical SAM-linked protein